MNLVYTKMKIFHYRDKLYSLPKKINMIKAPIHIRIKPTNSCNHNCCYCAYRTDNLQLGKDMKNEDAIPKEKMFSIIEDMHEIGVKAVTFTGGGDPFCYPHLLQAIKKISQTKIKFSALTNGSRLKGEIAELFAFNGTWLRVSMDGWDNESYKYYRNVSDGEFTKITRNMANFKKLKGSCVLSVNIIVDKYNANHLYSLIKKLKEVGVDSVKVSPCILHNDCIENNKYHEPFFNIVKQHIEKAIYNLKDDYFEIYDAYHELDNKFRKDYDWCPYQQILPVIGADLNIYSCQDKAYNTETGVIGSIKTESFKQMWFSDKQQFFKIIPKSHCNHHCVANAKNKLIMEYLNTDTEHIEFV